MYIAKRGLFSNTCKMCESRAAAARGSDRKTGARKGGLLGWILPALIFGIASLYYYNVDVPGADKVKAFLARLFSVTSEEGTGGGGGPEKTPLERVAAAAPATAGGSQFGSQTLTMNLRSDVLFEFNSSALKSAANSSLKDVTKVIRQRPNPSVVIRGYTDSIGSEQSNLVLGRQRAESVRDWLVKNGIPSKQISVIGMGAKDPVAPNTNANGSDNPAGREQNRRVTVSVSGA